VFEDLELDTETRLAYRSGRTIELTRTEFALLELLMRNAGRVLPREVISDRIWGYELGPESNSLEVFVSCIRRKTEAGGEPRLVQTVRGFGYTLRIPA
jgi:two-component system, OmpR family, response regulator MprA